LPTQVSAKAGLASDAIIQLGGCLPSRKVFLNWRKHVLIRVKKLMRSIFCAGIPVPMRA